MKYPLIANKTALIGKRGEDVALTYLRALGYKLHGRNIRLGSDEIDLICYDVIGRCLVFVEVKTRTRTSELFGPQSNLNLRKRQKLFRSAERWLVEHSYWGPRRIDAVMVVGNEVTDHLQGITKS